MNQEQTFTSTGIKLMHHTESVACLKKYGMARPISLQLAPTSRCNLNCSFCSNANREKHEDLNIGFIINMLKEMSSLGLKTVEWTGGGEPTLYKFFDVGVMAAKELLLKQGLITNGLTLSQFSSQFLSTFKWIRVSLNCLDYVKGIEIPEIAGTLGFSYVVNSNTRPDIKETLDEYVSRYSPSYVRIVPNCQATDEEQEANNSRLSKLVSEWGHPYFYQAKHFSKPERCYWGYFKPFVLHNGWVYPCSSVVLNDDSDKSFHSKYHWVRMEDLADMYRYPIKGRDWNCTHCVFRPQNDIVESLINPTGMEDFV